jgi:hypothetical protein
MSRHGEVDMFHIGPLKGIGTRHNVKHWGCANHEIRQSMAGNKRYYHLISGDERTREIILSECTEVGNAIIFLRNQQGKDTAVYIEKRGNGKCEEKEIPATLGPHLSSFFWNWLSIWEFTGSKKHRDMIIKGVEYMINQNQPYGLAGKSMSYKINIDTGQLKLVKHTGKPPMANIFGSSEIWMELADLLNMKKWKETLGKYGYLHTVEDYKTRYKLAPEATGVGSGVSLWDKNNVIPAAELIAFAGYEQNKNEIIRHAAAVISGESILKRLNSIVDNRLYALWGRKAIAVIALCVRMGDKHKEQK